MNQVLKARIGAEAIIIRTLVYGKHPLFSQAVKKDPQFTLAYLGLADAWGSFGTSVPGSVPGVKLYPRQVAAALKAQKLDDKPAPRTLPAGQPLLQ